MEKKINFLETQVDFYDQYLKQCLANLHAAKKKRVHFRTSNHLVIIISLFNELIVVELCCQFTEIFLFQTLIGQRSMKKETLRYSASKLHQKGILLSIDGLPENQFKNVLFEIVPTNTDGLFTIHAKFMGVRLGKNEIFNVKPFFVLFDFISFFFSLFQSTLKWTFRTYCNCNMMVFP